MQNQIEFLKKWRDLLEERGSKDSVEWDMQLAQLYAQIAQLEVLDKLYRLTMVQFQMSE